jgi:hypothetical protein
MDRESFEHVQTLIKDDPIFVSKGKRPQRPVQHQLAAFLVHIGGELGQKAGDVSGVAEGTFYNYSTRVGRALWNIKHNHLAWPGPQRRAFLKAKMSSKGFPGCIGSGDATFFHLATKPFVGGWSYWCQKKFYAVGSCVICESVALIIFRLCARLFATFGAYSWIMS